MKGASGCILFDLDGTLINTWRLYMESFRLTLEPLFRRRLSDAEILDLHPHAERRLLLSLVEEAEFTPAFDRFLRHYSSLHDKLFGGPYDGALDMLQRLHSQGYRLGIVTGKSREAWRITSSRLEAQAFEQFFDVVLTDDDVLTPKPSPEGLLKALDALDMEPDQAFFVGDSRLDRLAAQEAGMAFGAALWAKDSDDRGLFASAAQAVRDEGTVNFHTPASVMDLFRTVQAPPTRREQSRISSIPSKGTGPCKSERP